MQKRSVFAIVLLLVAAGAFAEAYTWTDDEGIVHFSDRPHRGATVVELGGSSDPRPRLASAAATTPGVSDTVDSQPTGYESLEVAAPGAEETLWNIGEKLDVTLSLTPLLKPGHQLRVYFDGKPQTVSGLRFQLQDVYRGVHNLQAEVIDAHGKLVIRSLPNRFYVQQNTVN